MRLLLLSVLLCGCVTTENPVISNETKNKEKDQYIDKIEAVVSDSASALVAVAPRLDKGSVKEVVESQVVRLSGIAKPTVKKTDEYRQMLDKNDSKAIQKDKESASKVDKETDELWAMVVVRDIQLEAAEVRADGEFKQKILWQYSTYGLAVFIAGLLALAFTPFKKSAGIVMAGGMLAMASAWIFESTWFTWIVAVAIGVSVLGIAISIYKAGKPKAEDKADSPEQDKH